MPTNLLPIIDRDKPSVGGDRDLTALFGNHHHNGVGVLGDAGMAARWRVPVILLKLGLSDSGKRHDAATMRFPGQ